MEINDHSNLFWYVIVDMDVIRVSTVRLTANVSYKQNRPYGFLSVWLTVNKIKNKYQKPL